MLGNEPGLVNLSAITPDEETADSGVCTGKGLPVISADRDEPGAFL